VELLECNLSELLSHTALKLVKLIGVALISPIGSTRAESAVIFRGG